MHAPRTAAFRLAATAAIAAVVVTAIGGAGFGCGRKTPPRPPQYVIPKSPAPVTVTPVPDGLKVSWRRPTEYVDGTTLEDLGGFDVYRACGEGDFWEPIAELPVTDRERFRKGRTFAYIDHSIPSDSPCRYRVVAATLDGYRSPPAEGVLGGPTPTPETAAPEPSPASGEETAPGGESGLTEPRVPAPLVSPTPFPPPLW